MRIPLDTICVKTGILCPSCQRKVDEGQVKPFEVDVMRALLELENEIKELRNASYVKSYVLNNNLIVILKLDHWSPELLRKIRQALSRKLNRRVRVVAKVSEPRELAAQLLFPLSVKGVNVVWLPDGTQKYVVRVDRRGARRLPIPKEEAEKILSDILNAPIEIRFESGY